MRPEEVAMRVLVVDDEPRVANAVKRGLEAEGFAVDVALTGTDGLWLAREHNYDAIILDVMLPEVDGYEICRTLREEDRWSPILMLTARDSDRDEALALDNGADDFLAKPFSFIVLVARVRALLRRGSTERPVVLTAGDLSLDPARHECRRGESTVDLTAREFAVLEYLMRRKGEVASKREILGNVWDFDFEGDPNIVEVYVRHLRRKIDIPFERHAIETVRGVGYRLADDGG